MNLYPFLSTLSIKPKDRAPTRLVLNYAQRAVIDEIHRQHNAGKPIRIITLKARQLGISTITEGVQFGFSFMWPNTAGLIVAHEDDSSEHLLGMTNYYWDSWPFRRLFHTKYAGRKHLQWVETQSGINIITAGGRGGGRSRTVHFLHASEVAFWPNPSTLMAGLNQTVPHLPGTFIMLESTANGVGGYFYDTWNEAMAGESDYAPLFFPWWAHPEYVLPHDRPLSLDSEERAIVQLMRTGIIISPTLTIPAVDDSEMNSRLMWRRWAIRNLCQNSLLTFHQEYPSFPEEAFLATGSNVFPSDSLTRCFEPRHGRRGYLFDDPTDNTPRFVQDDQGPLTIYITPSRDLDFGRYFVAGDPTHTTRGDYACAQVINRRNLEQVAVLRKRVDPISFAQDLVLLARYYNMADLSTESTGPGHGTIGAIMTMNYPNVWQSTFADKVQGSISNKYGFATNVQTKNWAVGALLKLIVDSAIKIHDRTTYQEMRDYVTYDNGEYGPADKLHGHDDTVMAMAICILCHLTSPPLPHYGQGPPPEMLAARDALNEVKEIIFAEKEA